MRLSPVLVSIGAKFIRAEATTLAHKSINPSTGKEYQEPEAEVDHKFDSEYPIHRRHPSPVQIV